MAPSTLSDQFEDITKAIDVIEDRIAFIVDRDELGDAMCEVVELGHRVRGLQGRLSMLCRNNGVAALHGQRTIGQYVASRTNNRARDIDQMANIAKWLRDYPILQAAHGFELTDAHVQLLRQLVTDHRTYNKMIEDQQIFVDAAAGCSFEGFIQACESWVIFNDPDGKEPKDQLEKSGFRIRIRKGQGGRGVITGECDAVTAADLRTAIEHEAEKLRRADKQAGIDRTDSQRRMAAVSALVKRGFARPDGTYPAPLGNIVMSQTVAEWALDTLNGDIEPTNTVPVHPTNIDGRCELIDGTAIHPFLAVLALGLIGPGGSIKPATLRRYVMDADSRALDVSVNARSFPEWMRTAAHVQTRGACSTHGCDNPYHWHQIDHIQPVHHGGQTRLDNAQPQCWPDTRKPAFRLVPRRNAARAESSTVPTRTTSPPGETDHPHHNTNPAAAANHPTTTPTPSKPSSTNTN